MTDRFRSKRLALPQQIDLLNRRGTWLRVNDVPAETTVTAQGGGLSLQAHLKGPNPDFRRGIRLALADPPVMWVVVSLVHSAYLRLVWHLGYECMCSRRASRICAETCMKQSSGR